MRNGWNGNMMGDNGSAWSPWLVAFFVVATLLLVLAALLVGRLLRTGGAVAPTGRGRAAQATEPPEEMLDRLFATGELDEATYRSRRTALTEMRQPVRHQE
ncbi:hypothetical protein [Kineosporia sp. A_224]|uniref:hypothetical protein n=1 Tax=Kineosporia sp. A_224 TaxID=1962180 RepID=UPI00117A6C2B|nr:hypothetical protein [Kineosporia sp. A_224]